MTLQDYAHSFNLVNRVGLHYSQFCAFSRDPAPANQRLAPRKKFGPGSNPPSRASIDIFPTLKADGYTVRLETFNTVIEFLGYMNPPAGGSPFPQFRLRQLNATALVQDGQTLALGGPVVEDATSKRKMHLLVFVTPTLIDPAGNRLYSDDERAALEARLKTKQPQARKP